MEDCGVNMLDDRLTDTESGRLASICWSISSSYGHTLCVSSAKYSNQISWTVGNFLSFSFIFSSTSSIPSNSLTLVELFWANLRGMYSAELPESNFIFSFRMNSKFRLAHPRKWKTRVTPIISSVWLPPSFWSVGEFLFRRLDAARCRHLLPLPGGFCWLVPIINSVMSTISRKMWITVTCCSLKFNEIPRKLPSSGSNWFRFSSDCRVASAGSDRSSGTGSNDGTGDTYKSWDSPTEWLPERRKPVIFLISWAINSIQVKVNDIIQFKLIFSNILKSNFYSDQIGLRPLHLAIDFFLVKI